MDFQISRVPRAGENDHLVLFTRNKNKFDTARFSAEEAEYVKRELANDSKQVWVNQYRRIIAVQLIEPRPARYKVFENMRKAGHSFAASLNGKKGVSVTLMAAGIEEEALAFAEGCWLGNYQFLKYRKEKAKEKNTLKEVRIVSRKKIDKQVARLSIRCEATCLARDLVNEPLNALSAVQLSQAFEKMGKASGFKVTVFNKAKIKSMKMGGLLAVNHGSVDPPTFTVMEWKPRRPVNKKPVVLVGKGVVFDTGGLSLKPTPNSMDYMKSDMAGAAVAGSVIYGIAKAKLPVHVIALVPATDNRPAGNAFVPGDVITMYSGATVEVLNTDAEGRMILADALHYAKQYKPQLVLEFSTLTGAAAVAIGPYGIVCMGNTDDRIRRKLRDSGNNVFERLVEFPYWEEYDEMIKSDIAEIKNVGGPSGGAITAGRFLNKFVDYPYMHFDIAGPAFVKTADSYRGKNGTGVGVRLAFDFLEKMAS